MLAPRPEIADLAPPEPELVEAVAAPAETTEAVVAVAPLTPKPSVNSIVRTLPCAAVALLAAAAREVPTVVTALC